MRGGSYDDAMRTWPHARDEEFRFVVDLARPVAGEVVVDVPAGGGYLAEHLPAGVDLVAVETSTPFAERCAERGITVVTSDLAASALPDETAHVVLSIAGMHHEPDHRALLSAWRRVLVPGGRLVAADVAAGSAEARFLDGFVGEHNGTGHRGWFFGDDVAVHAAEAGYREVQVVDGRYRWWAADELALACFCIGLFGLHDTDPVEVLSAIEESFDLVREPDRCGLPWGLRAVIGRVPA